MATLDIPYGSRDQRTGQAQICCRWEWHGENFGRVVIVTEAMPTAGRETVLAA